MGAYDDIQVPISGQPASSSLFGHKVREAIIDLDARMGIQEVSQQKVLARGRRTTPKTGITNTELGLLRLDDVPVLAGYMYRISSGPVNIDINPNVAAVKADSFALQYRVQFSATFPGTPAVNASSFLGRMRISVTDEGQGPVLPGQVFYYADTDGWCSFWLGGVRAGGSATWQVYADASNPLDLTVEFAGEDPGDTGVIL